jgi:hypothetical protein
MAMAMEMAMKLASGARAKCQVGYLRRKWSVVAD